jgi:MFS family permease
MGPQSVLDRMTLVSSSIAGTNADANAAPRPVRRILGFPWPAHTTQAERSSLIAGGLGWMLDAMDVMLYSMVLANLLGALGMSKQTGGLLIGLTLGASAVGGVLFGFVADRIGRTRSLMISILVYSLASGACGLSTSVLMLAAFRLILGLGMGGEWTTGATLIAETWPAAHRGKALGLMQSTWAIGEMIAAGVAGAILPRFGWRAVFFFGILPALTCFWILRKVPESEIWRKRGMASRAQASSPSQLRKPSAFAILNRRDIRGPAIIATAMNACGMFGYWGLFTWIPAFLSLPAAQGGRGLDLMKTTSWLVLMGIGKWLGYTLFGFAADSAGRKLSYAGYLLAAAILVPMYGSAHTPTALLVLGLPVAFFGTGFFSGFSAVAAELFPTEIRATAMGLSYNIGRGVSALAPIIVGRIASRYSFTVAFYLLAAAFALGAILALALPETKGKQLE